MSDNGYMMLDEAEAYNIGFLDGSDDQHYTDRIAAFGAIRRAAEVARQLDCYCGCHGDSYAIYIRRAIRAAIGSPKA